VAQFTPERVEQTPESRAEVSRLARAKGAALVSYTGLEYTNSGTQNIRAVLILWALPVIWMYPAAKSFKAGRVSD
jgi:hypothetical protein